MKFPLAEAPRGSERVRPAGGAFLLSPASRAPIRSGHACPDLRPARGGSALPPDWPAAAAAGSFEGVR